MLTIKTELRTNKNTAASRRLRKQKKCPAIIYQDLAITLNENDLKNPNILKHIYKNNIIKLVINDNLSMIVKIQDIHYHHLKQEIIHIDFMSTQS